MEQYNENNTKVINEHQRKLYESYEKRSRKFFLEKYSGVLEKMKTRSEVKILDIGGQADISLPDYMNILKTAVVK